MRFLRKHMILILLFCIAVVGGCIFGCKLGARFSGQWYLQAKDMTFDNAYENKIEQNTQKLEMEDAIPVYQEMEGYQENGSLVEQETSWNLLLVNKWNKLDEDFEAPELTNVGEGHMVDSRIADALKLMIADAKKAGYYIYILSAFRDMDKQISLYEAEVKEWQWKGYEKDAAEEKAGTIVAVPGTSEHHLGLAVDLVSSEHIALDEKAEKTKGYQWLVKHCQEYGFILRYPNGATDITGIIYEPWHFRYVGEEAAAEIMEAGITLEEYLGQRAANKMALID